MNMSDADFMAESFAAWFFYELPTWEQDEYMERYFAIKHDIMDYPGDFENISWQSVWDGYSK